MPAAFVFALFVFMGLAAPALAAFRDDCLALTPQSVVADSIGKALEFVTSGTNLSFPGQDASCNRASQVVRTDLCRVAMNLTTSARSEVVTEVWLPENWNGRLVTVAGGGLDGCVHYEDLAYATAHGFAAVGTNNGHAGTTGVQFLANEEVVIDFSWRALHVGVVAGKRLLQLLYKRAATGSYFLGCSLGGRQGIQAADMFPEDFDGIVAGAPAVNFNNLYSQRASYLPRTGAANSKDFITPTVWKTTVHDEVLRQCDKIDGVDDGIIEDPALCKFDPGTLLCRDNSTADSTGCLSSKQVEIVKGIFSPINDAQGNLFSPGMSPGSEITAADGLYSGKPWALSQNWFRYAVYNDPSWDAASYTLEKDGVFAEKKNPGDIKTYPNNLSAFKNRGGKLLMYHGQQDQQITSFRTPIFYDRLSQGMGLNRTGMDQFTRFFRISGLTHCTTGPGAWVIGQGGIGGNAATIADNLPFDSTHNVLAAIVDWVEGVVAPDTITGTKFVNDTVELGVDFQRRHCRYPLRNTYMGDGLNPKNADSWKCTCS
ncbi:putative flavin-containing monoamine oxidase A [Colletotrichum spaethianum]|uniref:Carboxylic ester hydrolase n=1 Tax=Colletotrichum spaethianum TaxID=700344 RepID=A0AA37LF17_9PEZI|nr:putative flavin-containing monoamine oxidase A [Colletotrichum spaethianum]GKT45239.1 putative flavin-containing monoamine oxidase A [Colletotrichum spaethianum]